LQRRTADVFLQRPRERGEVNLALTDHLGHLLSGDAVLVSKHLEDGHATISKLVDLSQGETVGRGDLVEDSAHLAHAHTSDARRVRDSLQNPLKVSSWLDTRSDC